MGSSYNPSFDMGFCVQLARLLSRRPRLPFGLGHAYLEHNSWASGHLTGEHDGPTHGPPPLAGIDGCSCSHHVVRLQQEKLGDQLIVPSCIGRMNVVSVVALRGWLFALWALGFLQEPRGLNRASFCELR